MEQSPFAWPPPKQENKTPPENINNGAASKVDFNSNHTPAVARRQLRATISSRTKTAAVLRCFIERGDRGLTCFEAVRLAHDYVLRSTVSGLQINHGLVFHRRNERVPGHAGSTVDCVRYWLNEKGRQRAAELLGISGDHRAGT